MKLPMARAEDDRRTVRGSGAETGESLPGGRGGSDGTEATVVRPRPWPELQRNLRPLSTSERRALSQSINARGVLTPILALPDGRIIDGHYRWELSGGNCRVEVLDLTVDEAMSLSYEMNLARRQLTPEQIEELRERMGRDRGAQRDQAASLRAQGMTQAEVAAVVGIPEGTLARWEVEGGSILHSKNDSLPPPPDLRVSVPREQYAVIERRLREGESARHVAADYGITERRVNQIRTQVEMRSPKLEIPEAGALPPKGSRLICADVLEGLRQLPDESAQCVVTSPPYWGLRDYRVAGQLGLEASPEEYVEKLVHVFRDVRRVLKKDGTLWLNLGDCYANSAPRSAFGDQSDRGVGKHGELIPRPTKYPWRLKPKDLVGMAWRVAFALQEDGWWLRTDIIWSKPNVMPESVADRPTRAHEFLFLFAKAERYFYNADAVREPHVTASNLRDKAAEFQGSQAYRTPLGKGTREWNHPNGRNLRSVWTIPSQPFPEAHFATFPEALVEPCVRAGTRHGDTVLDPFCGSGTVGVVALCLGRSFVGIDLNAEYIEMAGRRIARSASRKPSPTLPVSAEQAAP